MPKKLSHVVDFHAGVFGLVEDEHFVIQRDIALELLDTIGIDGVIFLIHRNLRDFQ